MNICNFVYCILQIIFVIDAHVKKEIVDYLQYRDIKCKSLAKGCLR